MEGIRCHIKKGTEYSFNYGTYHTEKEYYTIVKPKDFGNLREIAQKAKRNFKKQIAQDLCEPYQWMYIDLYDRQIEMEYYNSNSK
jgi:hypothetical protein